MGCGQFLQFPARPWVRNDWFLPLSASTHFLLSVVYPLLLKQFECLQKDISLYTYIYYLGL